VIVIDHDPQESAWHFRGLGRLIWELRRPIYRLLGRGGHSRHDDEQRWAEATEVHHHPGDGVSEAQLRAWLGPAGFDVAIYPHNHTVGAEVLQGQMGAKAFKYAGCQMLSGIDPRSRAAALSLFCVGKKRAAAHEEAVCAGAQASNDREPSWTS
jgi:hypothetical protein